MNMRFAALSIYLEAHARRLYASVTDPARVAAAFLARKVTRGRLPTPFTARTCTATPGQG